MTEKSVEGSRRRRRWIWFAAVALLVLFAAVTPLAIFVEDWGRDLTTNHAATSPTASNEALRPVESKLSIAELAGLVESTVDTMPHWELTEKVEQPNTIVISLVRTTSIMRFQDDITVSINATDAGSELNAESRSRVGRGDLGQNPRNLAELLEKVKARLDPDRTSP